MKMEHEVKKMINGVVLGNSYMIRAYVLKTRKLRNVFITNLLLDTNVLLMMSDCNHRCSQWSLKKTFHNVEDQPPLISL